MIRHTPSCIAILFAAIQKHSTVWRESLPIVSLQVKHLVKELGKESCLEDLSYAVSE